MTQIISDRKLKDEEEGSEEGIETEIKVSGREKDGNAEGIRRGADGKGRKHRNFHLW
jgi:hypothetical protein